MLEAIYERFYGNRKSLDQIVALAERCRKIPGDFVECGVAMASGIVAMKLQCPAKRIWGYDSFQGIHLAGPNDSEQPGLGEITHQSKEYLISSGVTVHPKSQVIEILEQYRLKEDDFVLVEGWVQETLPVMKPKKIAFLRLDMDLYDPTLCALTHLWPRLSKGGILLVDDWNLTGVVKACKDYFNSIGMTPEWIQEGENPVYIVK